MRKVGDREAGEGDVGMLWSVAFISSDATSRAQKVRPTELFLFKPQLAPQRIDAALHFFIHRDRPAPVA